MTVLITGATGFVGQHLTTKLIENCVSVSATIRQAEDQSKLLENIKPLLVKSLNDTLSPEYLKNQDVIIYLAARVHQMHDNSHSSLEAYRQINRYAVTSLAKQAIHHGVKRFIYLSSIKVNGEKTIDKSYQENDQPTPIAPYGQSKWEAEQELLELAQNTDLEVVILRPPLIYGPQVKANFLQLLKLVDKGIPFPFASIHNARSLLYVGNLVDAIITCIDHPKAKNQTFLVSDGQDLSTPELIRHIGKALDKPTKLLPVPPALLKLAATSIGKRDVADRLLGSLQVDSSKIRKMLNWQPPYTVNEGLKITADWFCKTTKE